MKSVAASALRTQASELLNRVAFQGDRIGIVRHGKTVAVLVPVDDLARLRALEDRIDARAARKALKTGATPSARRVVMGSAVKRKTHGRRVAPTSRRRARALIPWTTIKTDLGL